MLIQFLVKNTQCSLCFASTIKDLNVFKTDTLEKALSILPLTSNLLIVCADLDGVWDEFGSLFLRHGGHIFQQDSDLKKEEGRVSLLPSVLLHRSPELICDYQQTRALQGLLIKLQV